MMHFKIFEDINEIHLIEREVLRLLDWGVAVSTDEFKVYDAAVLKPLLTLLEDAKRPLKKRKSMTASSDDEEGSESETECDSKTDDTATSCSTYTVVQNPAVGELLDVQKSVVDVDAHVDKGNVADQVIPTNENIRNPAIAEVDSANTAADAVSEVGDCMNLAE